MNPIKAKVLIVDGDRTKREVLYELMLELGIVSVDEAPNGQVARSLLRRNHYDLVLTDWAVPLLSGIELLRMIRRGEAGQMNTPVLLLSSEVSAQRTIEALNEGASGFLERPFVPARLCEKVLRMIAAREPKSEPTHVGRQSFHALLAT